MQGIVKKSPKRTKSTLNNFIEYLKKVTKTLNEFEKAYIIFYWCHENIEYDVIGLKNNTEECSPDGVYKRGKTICEGYSRFFEYVGPKIGLKVLYLYGWAKKEEELSKFECHAWNAIIINGNYYLLDATWGAGKVGLKFIKKLNEFYFCTDPEYFIFSHFPKEQKWQLLKSPITKDEFVKRVYIKDIFFKYFIGCSEINSLINTKNEYTFRFYKKESNIPFEIDVDIEPISETEITEQKKYIDIKCNFDENSEYLMTVKIKEDEEEDSSQKVEFSKGNVTYKRTVKIIRSFPCMTYKINTNGNSKISKNEDMNDEFPFKVEKSSSKPLTHDEIIESLNKTKIQSIVEKAPKQRDSTLNDFIDYLKKETKDLNEFEKAYCLFHWIDKNISFGISEISDDDSDDDNFEEIYKCERFDFLYDKMYCHILKKIGLNIISIPGFSKNMDRYTDGHDIVIGNNSGWNVLEVKGNFYLIEPSFYLFDKDDPRDFYFCSNPEEIIFNHLPHSQKWQLIENPISSEEFEKRVKLRGFFFKYFTPVNSIYFNIILTVENRCNFTFKKKDPEKNVNILVCEEIRGYFGPNIKSSNFQYMIIDEKDIIDIKCIFKIKGKYPINIFVQERYRFSYIEIAKFHVECTNNFKDKKFDFLPQDYQEKENGNNVYSRAYSFHIKK